MKHFFTLCMAAAMIGAAPAYGAPITLQKALQLKSEGKAKTPVFPVRSKSKALKGLKRNPISPFHKVMEQNAARARKAPARVTPKGDNIYGFLGFTYDDLAEIGVYEFNQSLATIKWADALFYDEELSARAFALQDGVVKGYSNYVVWGYMFSSYYAEYDFETGEVLTLKENENFENSFSYFSTAALNTNDGTFFGYGLFDEEPAFMSAPADDPFNYTLIAPAEEDEACISICYNPTDASLYGVTSAYDFVKIAENGTQEKLMHLDVPDGAQYITGLTFDPVSNLFYWNINTNNDDSWMATIDLATQSLDIYDELWYAEEYVSLFTTDVKVNPLQPQRPAVGTPVFEKGSLTGTVEFTMPSELAGGEPIKGAVQYRALLDGEVYTTGSAVPGETVKISYTVTEGMHVFGAVAVYDGIESVPSSTRAYVGFDTPLAPAGVKLSDKEVSWNAVTEGVHGGYVDADAVTYTVSLNGEKVGTTSSTSIAVEIPQDIELTRYVAEVVAESNGLTSSVASSAPIVAGTPLNLPQFFAPDPKQFELCVPFDSNGDGAGWTLEVNYDDDSYYLYSNYSNSSSIPMDDWLFLPQMTFGDADRFYSFSMEASLRNDYFYLENMEVLLCSAPTPENVVATVVEEFSPESSKYQTVDEIFKVPAAGVYYIALHCTSVGDQYGLRVRNISIDDNNITAESPAAVSGLKAEESAPGQLEAKVSFTFPTRTVGGAELPADTSLTAHVSAVGSTEVSGHPGESVSVLVATAQGNNDVKVYISSGDLNSPSASVSVFTGLDVPAGVEEVTATTTPDMLSMTIEWTPVTEGENGKYVDPAEITYDIYIRGEYGFEFYEGGIKGTSYTYYVEPGSPQEFVQLGVMSVNDAGNNGYVTTASGILGTPYDLPILEDFDDDDNPFQYDPWVIYGDSSMSEWAVYYTSSIDEKYADLTTNCLVAQGYEGAETSIGMPRFTTVGVDNVTVILDVCGDFNLPKTTILAAVYGKDPVEIGEVSVQDEGFHKVSVALPAEFLGQEWVGLFINAQFENGDEILAIESISVVNDSGSGVAAAADKGVTVVGGHNSIKVSGLNASDVTVSTLDGRIAARASKVSGNASFQVEKGVYVVKAAGRKVKVVVK